MKFWPWFLVLSQLLGCSSTVNVDIDDKYVFPNVLVTPLDTEATLVVDPTFKQYIATPNEKTNITLGPTQMKMFEGALKSIFKSYSTVETDKFETSDTVGIVIAPRVQEVQTATPTESKMNIYEVWVKYQFDISSRSGEAIANWYMPAYGKTSTAFLRSKEEALEQAAIMALRDAAANLSLRFHRIPALEQWLDQNGVKRVTDNE